MQDLIFDPNSKSFIPHGTNNSSNLKSSSANAKVGINPVKVYA